MKSHATLIVSTVMISILLTSCVEMENERNDENQSFNIELTTQQKEVLQNSYSFDIDFIREMMKANDSDWLISPLSMKLLLGMLANGSKGETSVQICKALGFNVNEVPIVNECFHSIINQMSCYNKDITTKLANAFIYQPQLSVKSDYLEKISQSYQASCLKADFSLNSDISLINEWVYQQTDGLIPMLYNSARPDLLAILVNTLYYRGEWTIPFDKKKTVSEWFYLKDSGKRKIKMMRQVDAKYLYGENSSYQWLSLPFGNQSSFEMKVILPKEGANLSEMLSTNLALWDDIRYQGEIRQIDLWLPRFHVNYRSSMNVLLSNMGMPCLFSGGDFSNIADNIDHVDDIYQVNAISVDEEGSKAAAVSVAEIATGIHGVQYEKAVFHANKPFLYLITESNTGLILFAGYFSGK